MQPTFKQVPPNIGDPASSENSSIHAVFKPSCEALIAATYPAGPPPITTTSYINFYYPINLIATFRVILIVLLLKPKILQLLYHLIICDHNS